jgi:hypothetical protein
MFRRNSRNSFGPIVMWTLLHILSPVILIMVEADKDGYNQQYPDRYVQVQQHDEMNEYYGGLKKRYFHKQSDSNGYYPNRGGYDSTYRRDKEQQTYSKQEGGMHQEQERRKAEEVEGDDAVEEQQNDDAYATDDDGAYNKFSVCSDAVIKVLDLSIYCDSPGTFYYGSGKYRNNASCKGGDKAKIQLDFYISQPSVIQSAGGYAILDISATGKSGWYQQNIKVFENADMCSTPTLKSLKGSTCPAQGKYRIKSHFYWPEDVYGGNSFYPSVTVGFKSSVRSNQYDYGGANTPYCRGSTFVTWTDGIRTTYANAISNFMKSFGILLLTIVLTGGFIWFLVKKPTSVKDAGQKMGMVKRSVFADDHFDFSAVHSPKNGQYLVDF